MSTLELKEHLKSKIDATNDDNVLAQITAILGIENETIIMLSDEQKKTIKKSQIQYLEGNFIENDVLNQEMEKWLKE
jgi:hypothetical protein